MKARFTRVVGSGPVYPMLILFGLNAVDELDRTAFAILAPEIRDEFGLGFQGLLTLSGVVVAFALACLLYTSPSPRDAHESRMPSSA